MAHPRTHRVLAGVSRVAVLEALRRADRALPVPEIAERVGLHPNTVRTHLELLVEHGYVQAEVERRRVPGRPRLVYSATGESVEDGTRNYRLLAQILAGHLAASSSRPDIAALEAGRAFGSGLVADAGHADTGEADHLQRLVELLAAVGFQPEPGSDGQSVLLHHCPFRELAEANPDLVCGVHLGLMQGALRALAAPVSATRLLPFVEPHLCVAVLDREES